LGGKGRLIIGNNNKNLLFEIKYLHTGFEGHYPNARISFAFALRKFYFVCFLRIKDRNYESIFWRHFVIGFSREQKKFKLGFSK
jgi:hypothetical protein